MFGATSAVGSDSFAGSSLSQSKAIPVFNANTTQDERDSDPQGNDDEQEEVYSNDDDDEGDYWAIWTLVVVVRCTQNVLD